MQFKTLEFILPEIVICLNGMLPDANIFHKLLPIPVVAADGAAIQLRKKKFLPQYIVGDLDSLAHERSYWEQYKNIEIEEVNDQKTTDFEKSLDFIEKKQCNSAIILGIHGGELDHTLNNWSILMRYGKGKNLAVYDAGKIAFPLYESIIIRGEKGEMISLIPQPEAILTTNGLEWDLNNEELKLGYREGARNRAVQEVITLNVHSGSILVFIKADLPYIPKV